MTCKSCGKKISITRAVREQGWVECEGCHAIFSVNRDEGGEKQAYEGEPDARVASAAPAPGTAPLQGQPQDTLHPFAAAVGSGNGRMNRFLQKMADIAAGMAKSNRPPEGPRAGIALPKGMEIESGSSLLITRRWMNGVSFFLLFFTILWDVFMWAFLSEAFATGLDGFPWFILLHLGVGFFLTYTVVCQFVNRSTICVSAGMLEVRHGPLWWPGQKTFNTQTIKQIFVRKKVSQSSKGGSSTSYSVEFLDDSGTPRVLLANLTVPQQALYIEQQLESFLGITDTWVEGSYT